MEAGSRLGQVHDTKRVVASTCVVRWRRSAPNKNKENLDVTGTRNGWIRRETKDGDRSEEGTEITVEKRVGEGKTGMYGVSTPYKGVVRNK